MSIDQKKIIALHAKILAEFGYRMKSNSRILDFGCGSGACVMEYRKAGIDAYGCDIIIEEKDPHLRPVERGSNKIPFEDNSFDFVYSDQVMEHVQDHASVLAEISRVLKPGGVSLHIFPSKWKPIECHVYVPFGGAFRNRNWLRLWALLGIRNSYQMGMSAMEVVRLNHEYLHSGTNYLSRRRLEREFRSRFGNVEFAEHFLVKHGFGKARLLWPLVRRFPLVGRLFGTFSTRVLFVKKHLPDSIKTQAMMAESRLTSEI